MKIKFFKDMAQNTNLSSAFDDVRSELLNDSLLGFASGHGTSVGFVIVGGKVCQLQVCMRMDGRGRQEVDKKGIESNIYVFRPYFRIVDCPGCWVSDEWEEWWKIAGEDGYDHRGHRSSMPVEESGRPASNRWLKSRGLPENGQRLDFATRGIRRVTCLRFRNASNAAEGERKHE